MQLPSGSAFACQIAGTLVSHGFASYLVGGCVRDLLLGLEPKDYDVASSARPEQVAALFPGSELIGAHFGVILVKHQGQTVEVATFRSDGAYSDGRRPETVTYETDPRQDALRRDFTINSLFFDIATNQVLDFCGGQDDLRAGILRAIGEPETRFEEDYLRMLRAVRFAARFGYVIEPHTLSAIRKLHARILDISAERIREELNRILTEGGARRGFELLSETRLLESLLPEVKAMQGVEQPAEYHPEGDVWQHTLLMLEGLENPTTTLAWAVLLHDVAKPPTFTFKDRIRFSGHAELGALMSRTILNRLRLAGHEVERIHDLVLNHLRFIDVKRMKESTLKRFLRQPHFEEHLALHRLDCLSSNRRLENYEFARQKLEQMKPEELRPARLITGEDLIALGYPQGHQYREILSAVEDAQLEGGVATREQALELVRQRFPISMAGTSGKDKLPDQESKPPRRT